MSASNIFGPIIDGDTVEEAVKASLEVWISEYLGEMERLKGYAPNEIQRPLGIVTSSQFAKWPEDEVPLILIVSGGTGKPVRRSKGEAEVAWSIAVNPIVSDTDEAATRKLALTYAAAVRAALEQHKRLRSALHPDGFASFTHWEGESYTDLAFLESRTLGTARVMFSVGVESVVTAFAGPREPRPDPKVDPGPWPTGKRITVVLDPKSPTGALT